MEAQKREEKNIYESIKKNFCQMKKSLVVK